jgi:uncharacterized protein (TIGR02271 family)
MANKDRRAELRDEEQVVELREEELRARTVPVETGQVRLGKEIVEEEQSIEVPVTREEVTIERHSVPSRPADGPIENTSETISVPVREEQVSVDKRTVVTDEIVVDKREVQDTERVTDTVRREEARIERDGDVEVDERR